MTYGYARCNQIDTISDLDEQKRIILSLGVSQMKQIFSVII